jgi:hypothetical protein
VGQDQWEEVDWVPTTDTLAGSNFGWNCWEANNHRVPACDPTSYVPPVIAYANPNGSAPPSAAVTGGVVVHDPALPSLDGRYLYADFYAGRVHSVRLAKPVTDDRVETDLPSVSNLVAFGEDADSHVYVVSLTGNVQRIVEGASSGTGSTPPTSTDPGPTPTQPEQQPQSPGPGSPATPVVPDTTAPRLSVRAARRQDVVRRRVVGLSVACDEACIVRVGGSAGGVAMRSVLKRLAPGKRVVLELRLPSRARRVLAQRGAIRLTLRARDAAGNLRTAALTVRVRR